MSQPQNRIASGMSFAQLGLLSGRSYQKYILPHDSVSVCPHATAASARQFHGPAREGLEGEKAAQGDASLPVPPAPHLPRQSNTPTQVRTGSAPGEGERKCEGVFPQKSGKTPRISAALTHAAPRPPPTLTRHRHLAGRRGYGGRRIRPPLPTSGIEKIHFDCENLRGKKNGGERGIRTLGEVSPSQV